VKQVISFFIRKPIWANAIIVLTLIFGVVSMLNLNRAFFPELNPTNIFINVSYPGASPVEMEEGVTIKVEEALKGISGIEEISSSSQENYASVTVQAYQDADLDEVAIEVKNAVDGISNFPLGAEKPIVNKQKTSGMSASAAFISLSGEVDLFELKRIAEEVEDDFLRSGVISEVTLNGYPPLEFSIEVKEDALLRYQLTFDDIVLAVRNNNRDVSGGAIKTTEEELLIRSNAKQNDASKISRILLRADADGRSITIGDVAEVSFQFAETPMKGFMNGQRNIVIQVNKTPTEDLGAIANFIEAYTEKFNKENHAVEMTIMFQFYDMLNDRIQLLRNNGIIGLILVLVTLGLFLSLRLSFWVAFGIPFSFLGMFIIGVLNGMTINMISLFGMILVVGILVDDGIVIAENIFSHFERGKKAHQAALDGTTEVLPSVFTSVLTTIVAFSVLLFIEGMEMMAEMAFVVIAALAFSLIEAFLILPSHLSSKKILNKNNSTVMSTIRRGTDRFIAFMRDTMYGTLLKWVLRRKRLAVFIPLVFIAVVIAMLQSKVIRTTFFPSIPFDDLKIQVAFTPGEREQKTQAFLEYCEEKVLEVRDELLEETGDTLIKYTTVSVGYTESLGESGANTGMIRASLDLEGKGVSSFEIARRIQEKIGPVYDAEKFVVGGANRWGKPVSISLSGKNFREIKEAKEFLKAALHQLPDLKDITDNSGIGKREVLLELKPKAYLLGLNHTEISRQIRQGFFGEEAQRLIVGTDEVKIWVRYPEEGRGSLGRLERSRIKTSNGQEFPLSELVNYQIERGEVNIRHFDGAREIRIEADQQDPYASTTEIITKIKTGLMPELKARYKGLDVEFKGQVERAEKSTNSGGIMLLIAILIMVLIISLNFNSVYQAILIIAVLPAGIFGAILGHGIQHLPVSTLSAWGMIALMGILVNDAVVFLDTYNRNLKSGMLVKEAIYNAGISRFRPILLTSITTVAGLYPLILEDSFQAQFLIPMAVAVAYGVLFGTFFILVFFPVLVLGMNDIKRLLSWFWNGKKPTPEEIEPTVKDMERWKTLEGEL
jgi:multidrug efflux pump subunit AcrB